MNYKEALDILRKEFAMCKVASQKALRANPLVPLYSCKAPGWAYYVCSDSAVFDGYKVGK